MCGGLFRCVVCVLSCLVLAWEVDRGTSGVVRWRGTQGDVARAVSASIVVLQVMYDGL